MLRFIFNFNIFLKSSVILLMVISSADFLMASDDWVYDLRYKEFLSQANNGDGSAMYELGVMTERGRGTERNIEQAITWYKKAIENNNSGAYVRLGKLYLEGVSVEKNYGKAFKYLQDAKKNKSSGAYYYLAVMYENGYGTKKNLSKAKSNYDKAAKWGHYEAKQKSEKIAEILKRKNKKNKRQQQEKLSQYEEPSSTDMGHDNQTKISTKKKSTKPFVTITDVKKNLLTGMWFNGDSPLGFLPSPRTYCIPKNKIGLRCVSKEMLRNTGREKIYYLIESKISNIDNYGDFTITYTNKVTKVDVYNTTNESGENYVSRIKIGPQKKLHILKCNVTGENVNCNKNGMQNYVFVNLIKKNKKKYVFEEAFE